MPLKILFNHLHTAFTSHFWRCIFLRCIFGFGLLFSFFFFVLILIFLVIGLLLFLVLFDKKNGARCIFYTYIYTYNETISFVNLQVHEGIMEHICPTGAACIIFINDQSHFMFFENSELHIESFSQPEFYGVGLYLGD